MGQVIPFETARERSIASAVQDRERTLFEALDIAEEAAMSMARMAITFRAAAQQLRESIIEYPECVLSADRIDPRLALLQSLEASIISVMPELAP